MIPENGVYENVPEDVYHGWDLCSYSRLKVLATKTPAHLRMVLDSQRDTPAMRVGTALHRLVLEGREALESAFAVGGPINEKTGKPYGADTQRFAMWEAEQGKPVLSLDQMHQVESMAAAIGRSTAATGLLAQCPRRELSMIGSLHGQRVKARGDAYGDGMLLDIKTTGRGAGRADFERTIGSLGYGLQSAVYANVAWDVGLPVDDFVFIVVESEPPYDVGVYRIDDEVIDLYEQALPRLLERYADCVSRNHWPGTDDEVQRVGIPLWLKKALQEQGDIYQ